jgi:hypothetical protein
METVEVSRRLEKLATAAGTSCGWLEAGWRYA